MMSSLRIAYILLFGFAIQSCKVVPTWDSKGPFDISGCIRSIYFDPINEKRLYAAAENGGLWVLSDYTNSTGSWKPLTDKLDNLQSRGVAKSPADSGYIVYGNGLGHLFHSFNNGTSWDRLTLMNFGYIRKMQVRSGLIRLTQGGSSRFVKRTDIWVASRPGLFRIRLLNDAFSVIDTLYHGDVLDMMFSPNDPATLFIGVRRTGLLKSPDNGLHWDTTLPWDATRDTTAEIIRIAGVGRRVVVKFGNRILRNDNNGEGNFSDISPGFADEGGSDIGYRGNYSGRNNEWLHSLAVSPVDSNLILAGQVSLAITRNGGNTWEMVSNSNRIGHEDIQSILFSKDGKRIFLGNDGGVFEYRLDGSNAKGMNNDLVTMQFFRVGVNGNFAVGNADHQGLQGTQNLDAPKPSWERASPRGQAYGNNGLENDFVYADPKNPNRFFVVFQDRDILRLNYPHSDPTDLLVFSDTFPLLRPFQQRTSNSARFNQLNYPVNPFAIDPRDTSHTMLTAAHTSPGAMFEVKMTRQGDREPTGGPADNCGDSNLNTFCYPNPVTNFSTWRRTLVTNDSPVVSIEFSKRIPGKVYLLDEAGKVYVRQEVNNDAEPWTIQGIVPIPPGDFARQIVSDRFDSLKLFAFSHQAFFRSSDGGTTWTQVGSASLPAIKFNAMETHPLKRNQVFLATDTAVYISENSGTSWKVYGKGLPHAPIMQVYVQNNYLYAVSFGRGLWRSNLRAKKGFFVKGQ